MDTVTQWLCPQQIELDLDVSDRWEALRVVSAMIERSRRLSAAPVFRALLRREKAASTGVGNGLAIPHARVPGIAEPVTVYVRTKAPVEFAASDRKRVSDLFVILVPTDGANEKHLQLLALVAEVFSDSDFRARLAAASDPQDVRSAFSQWISESRLAATEGSCNSQRAATEGSYAQCLSCQTCAPLNSARAIGAGDPSRASGHSWLRVQRRVSPRPRIARCRRRFRLSFSLRRARRAPGGRRNTLREGANHAPGSRHIADPRVRGPRFLRRPAARLRNRCGHRARCRRWCAIACSVSPRTRIRQRSTRRDERR